MNVSRGDTGGVATGEQLRRCHDALTRDGLLDWTCCHVPPADHRIGKQQTAGRLTWLGPTMAGGLVLDPSSRESKRVGGESQPKRQSPFGVPCFWLRPPGELSERLLAYMPLPSPSSVEQPITDRPQSPAWPSLLIPGLAQILGRRPKQGFAILLVGLALLGLGLVLGRTAGLSAEIFFFVTVILPWWFLQAYDATLPLTDDGWPLREALQSALAHAHDIRYLGLLFLLTALMDLYIILVNPEYALALFCAKPVGWIGILAKIQSPSIHVLIGYGFLQVRRWALLLYLAYAGFGLLNATVNFACFGYGRVRTVFFLSLLAFTAYIWWRRARFR